MTLIVLNGYRHNGVSVVAGASYGVDAGELRRRAQERARTRKRKKGKRRA